MGKYTKKKTKKSMMGVVILALAVLLVLVICIGLGVKKQKDQAASQNTEITQAEVTADTFAESSASEETVLETKPQHIDLSNGLRIERVGSYAGIYMEDGSDEPVADVMMILLENTSEQDLQLARISIAYPDFTAEFEVTNLPAGERAVVLEKNRHSAPMEDYLSAECENVAFFSEAMNLAEDRISINAMNGMLEVTNCSEEDITGYIFIYYKNSATDLLYGGITYRVTIADGLKAGETKTVIAGHYTQQNSRLLMVDCKE